MISHGEILHAKWVINQDEEFNIPRVEAEVRVFRLDDKFDILFQATNHSFRTSANSVENVVFVINGNIGVWLENVKSIIANLIFANVKVEISYNETKRTPDTIETEYQYD